MNYQLDPIRQPESHHPFAQQHMANPHMQPPPVQSQVPGPYQTIRVPGSQHPRTCHNYDPLLALFTLKKPKTAKNWDEVEPQQQHLSSQEVQNELNKFQQNRMTVKRALHDIPSATCIRIINELVKEQTKALWKHNKTLQYALASVDIEWRSINRRQRVIQSITVVLKTEPSGFTDVSFVSPVIGSFGNTSAVQPSGNETRLSTLPQMSPRQIMPSQSLEAYNAFQYDGMPQNMPPQNGMPQNMSPQNGMPSNTASYQQPLQGQIAGQLFQQGQFMHNNNPLQPHQQIPPGQIVYQQPHHITVPVTQGQNPPPPPPALQHVPVKPAKSSARPPLPPDAGRQSVQVPKPNQTMHGTFPEQVTVMQKTLNKEIKHIKASSNSIKKQTSERAAHHHSEVTSTPSGESEESLSDESFESESEDASSGSDDAAPTRHDRAQSQSSASRQSKSSISMRSDSRLRNRRHSQTMDATNQQSRERRDSAISNHSSVSKGSLPPSQTNSARSCRSAIPPIHIRMNTGLNTNNSISPTQQLRNSLAVAPTTFNRTCRITDKIDDTESVSCETLRDYKIGTSSFAPSAAYTGEDSLFDIPKRRASLAHSLGRSKTYSHPHESVHYPSSSSSSDLSESEQYKPRQSINTNGVDDYPHTHASYLRGEQQRHRQRNTAHLVNTATNTPKPFATPLSPPPCSCLSHLSLYPHPQHHSYTERSSSYSSPASFPTTQPFFLRPRAITSQEHEQHLDEKEHIDLKDLAAALEHIKQSRRIPLRIRATERRRAAMWEGEDEDEWD